MRKSLAMQALEKLSFEAKLKLYPNTPSKWIPPTKYNQSTANGLTKCIVDFILFNGLYAERISVVSRQVNGKFIVSSMQRGTADISAIIWGGKSLKIEVKIGKDRQSEDQKKYQNQIEASGALYYIAKDFDSFFEYFQAIKKAHV